MTHRPSFWSLAGALLLLISSALPTFAATATPTVDPTSPDFDFFGAVPWELPPDAVEMRVDKVHDGDSINLTKPNDDWWEQYRIIGIQAPEIQGPYKDEECYGQDAARFLQAWLTPGTTVYIQQDISNTDRNDRFLRHVFFVPDGTEDAYLVSEVMVLGGYARARSYPPDTLYDDVLAEAMTQAKKDDVGMWDACPAASVTPVSPIWTRAA